MTTQVSIEFLAENVEQVRQEIARLNESVTGYVNRNREAGDSIGGIVTGMKQMVTLAGTAYAVNKVLDFSQALIQARVEIDKLQNILKFTFGPSGVAQQIGYVADLSDKLGLNFQSAAAGYAKFAAAARGTAVEGESTQKVFTAIASATAALGLSAAEADGIMLALTQMMGKGVVQAEEFRGQLAERLPIATQAAAKALGVTTAEFQKMLETGQVIAADFLPKFADALLSALGDTPQSAAGSAQAAMNRLTNSWEQFKRSLGDTGAADAGLGVLNQLTRKLRDVTQAMDEARRRGWGGTGQMAAGASGLFFGYDTPDEAQTWLQGQYQQQFARLQKFREKADNDPVVRIGDWWGGRIREAEENLKKIEDQMRSLTVTTGKIGVPNLKEQWRKEQDQLQQAADAAGKAWESSKHTTKAEETAAKLADLAQQYNRATTAAIAAGASQDELMRRATQYAARAKEIMFGADKKGKAPADRYVMDEGIAALMTDENDATFDPRFWFRLDQKARQHASQQERATTAMGQTTTGLVAGFGRDLAGRRDAMSGMPDSDRRLAADLREVERAATAAREALSNKLATMKDDVVAQAAYRDELEKVNAAEAEQKERLIALHAEQDRMNRSWEFGAQKALRSYADAVENVATTMEQVVTRAFKGMEDALVQFVMTAKLDFKSLANSIIADMIRMQIQQSITKPLSGFFGSILKGITGGGFYDYGGAPLDVGNMSANGNVFTSAGLHRYVNTIVSSPTLFKFAQGGSFGLMGEAGPEAIMPLKRGADGKLGVSAEASAPNIAFNLINKSGTQLTARQQGPSRKSSDGYIIDVVLEALQTDPKVRAALSGV